MQRSRSTSARRSIVQRGLALGLALWTAGCANNSNEVKFSAGSFEHYQRIATKMEYSDQLNQSVPPATEQPLTLNTIPREFWDVSLEQSVQLCLQNSPVLRDLGGFVLRSPQTTRSIHQPALAEVDPRFGVEAALSEFDTTFAARTSWEKNDRALNNLLLGGGTNFFKQDLGVVQYQLQKRAATGSLFTLRHNTDYDANSAPANLFGSAWNTNFEAEMRQPLLQNAGVTYNRIAGPNSQPGQANGVLIARTNTDLAIADFETGIRDLVSNVENAYWDLYYSYRDLDAKLAARDSALDSWRRVQALNQAGRKGGEAEKEAEAREQYFRFQEEVQNALSGRLVDGTQTNNGSSGGSFRANGGVQVAERRLRLLLGLPITDGRLLRPIDQPSLAKVEFEWSQTLSESYIRRSELRKQQWLIKRRELELLAARNFLQPNLDTVGRYRWRGFGKDLLDPASNGATFDNAYENLFDGQFQEWQLGLELNMPLGFRRGHAAVRHAELQLTREKTLLREQERDVQLGLSNAMAELQRAFTVAQTNYNRRAAAKEHLAAILAAYEADKASLDLVLEAQRRAAETESRFHAALVEYALAIKNIHFEKGTLLDFNNVGLAEGPWPDQAYRDAAKRDGSGYPTKPLSYVMNRGPRIDGGSVPQGTGSRPYLMSTASPANSQPVDTVPAPSPTVAPQQAEPIPTGNPMPLPTTPAPIPMPELTTPPVLPANTSSSFSPLMNPAILNQSLPVLAPQQNTTSIVPSGKQIAPSAPLLRDNLQPYLSQPALPQPATVLPALANPTPMTSQQIQQTNFAWPVSNQSPSNTAPLNNAAPAINQSAPVTGPLPLER